MSKITYINSRICVRVFADQPNDETIVSMVTGIAADLASFFNLSGVWILNLSFLDADEVQIVVLANARKQTIEVEVSKSNKLNKSQYTELVSKLIDIFAYISGAEISLENLELMKDRYLLDNE